MSLKGKAAAKVAAKTGGRAVPGLGQAIMVIEGAPVAVEEGSRAYQILAAGKKKSDELRKAGKYMQATKVLYQAQIEAQKAAAVGIGRTAITALVAREAADSVLKQNPDKALRLNWLPRPGEATFRAGARADIPELNLLVVVAESAAPRASKSPRLYRAKIWQRDERGRLVSPPLVQLGPPVPLERIQQHAEDWIAKHYPLWALAQVAQENPRARRNGRRLEWEVAQGSHIARLPALGLRIYLDRGRDEAYSVVCVNDKSGAVVARWQGPWTLQNAKMSVEDWLAETYPLWALAGVAPAARKNPRGLDWHQRQGRQGASAKVPVLGLTIVISRVGEEGYSALVWAKRGGGLRVHVQLQTLPTLRDQQHNVEAWLEHHYPLWALAQVGKENPMKSNPRSKHSVHQARKSRKSRAKWKRKIERTGQPVASRRASGWERPENKGKHPSKPKSKRPWQARRNPMMNEGPLYQDVLAHLRALQWLSWTSHWTAAGPSYYGDHQLLQRLYDGKGGGPDINEEIDALGERMVAYFGPPSVSPEAIVGRVHQLTDQAVKSSADQFEALLSMEMQLQQAIRRAWKANQASGEHMSLGIDDLLMGLANEREGAIYLLRRRLGGRKPLSGTVPAPPAAIAPPAVPVSFRTVEPQDESLTPQPLDMSFRPWSKQAAANPALPPGFSLERGMRGGRPVFHVYRMGMDTGKYALRGEKAAELVYKMARRA